MKTIYLLDTNVLIHTPDVLCEYDNIHITSDIFREIENLELKAREELKYNIRRAKRKLNEYIDAITILDDKFCSLAMENLPTGYSDTYVDNMLLAVAIELNKDNDVVVLTNDLLLQFKVKAFDVQYKSVDFQYSNYNGVYRFEYSDIESDEFTETVLLDLYDSNKKNPLGLVDGQYLELYNTDSNEVKGIFVFENGQYKPIYYKNIDNEILEIKPRNTRQKMAFHLMQDRNKKIKFIQGLAGAGKDMIMLSQAFYEVINNGKHIIWLKPNKGIKGVGSIGALPGDKYEKMHDTYIQLADYLGGEILLEDFIKKGQICIENMEFIRGRQFDNAIIYCTEAQNLTEEIIKLIISRAGDDTEICFNGDSSQSDVGSSSGLKSLNKLAGHPLFGKVELLDVERSDVAAMSDFI